MAKGHRKVTHFVHHKRLSRSSRSYRTRLMFQALEKGNIPMVKLLLKEGGLRINARLAKVNRTLLHVIAYNYQRCPAVQRLVENGCRINSTDFSGDTALHIAVRYHKIHVASQLISLGADVRAKNIYGETPLQLAVVNKRHVDLLKEMIPNGDRYSRMNFYGLDSLRIAIAGCRNRDWIRQKLVNRAETISSVSQHSLVKMLLNAGADVNAKDINDCSPIQCAVYTGDLVLVKTLIDAGADIDNRNATGVTALHDAVLCCNEAMVHLLLSRGVNVAAGHTLSGDTALHWSALLNIDSSHQGIMRKLMEFGSDLNQSNAVSRTPFNYVVQYGDVNLVSFFIDEHKADLKKLGSDGSNALVFAAQNENEHVMDLVLKSGLEIGHKCKAKLTALHHASGLSLLENVRWLISNGADVNAKDRWGRTPLFYCINDPHLYLHGNAIDIPLALLRANFAEERRRVMRLLLELGTEVNHAATSNEIVPRNKETLLELAITLGDTDARKVIIEYVAEIEARTSKPMFDDRNLMVIDGNPEIKSYYQKCRDELTAMRTTKIEGSFVAYMSVLTEHLDVVARYVRNEKLVKNFDLNLQSAYPIYTTQLKEKFNSAIARQKTIEKVSTVLSTTLQLADPTHVVFEVIFKYLTEADVKLLIGYRCIF